MSAGIIYNNGSALTSTAAGSLGDVLTSQGSGSAPIFAPGGGGGGTTGFFAYLTSTLTNVTGSGTPYTVIFDTATRNDGTIYNTNNGVMTANKTGFWLLNAALYVENITVTDVGLNTWFENITQSIPYLNLGVNPYVVQNANQSFLVVNMTSTALLNANDNVSCVLQGIGNSVDDLSLIGTPGAYYCYYSAVFLGPNAITAQYTYSSINSSLSPYTVLSTDQYMGVDSTAGSVTLLFPDAPTPGQYWTVKDVQGTSATNNIIVTSVSGSDTFDGSTSVTILQNFGSLTVLYNGAYYEVS